MTLLPGVLSQEEEFAGIHPPPSMEQGHVQVGTACPGVWELPGTSFSGGWGKGEPWVGRKWVGGLHEDGKVGVHPVEGKQLRGTKGGMAWGGGKRCQGRLVLEQENMGVRS